MYYSRAIADETAIWDPVKVVTVILHISWAVVKADNNITALIHYYNHLDKVESLLIGAVFAYFVSIFPLKLKSKSYRLSIITMQRRNAIVYGICAKELEIDIACVTRHALKHISI